MLALLALLPARASSQSECYAIADSDKTTSSDELIRINLGTALSSAIGSLSTLDVEAATLSLDGSVLYAANGGQLGTVGLLTGTFTALPSSFGTANGSAGSVLLDDVDGLTIDPYTGILYGIHRTVGTDTPDLLFQIQPLSGAHVPDAFGAGVDYVEIPVLLGLESIDDISIDPIDGQMYGIANDDATGYDDRLVLIDKATGSITDVGSFGVIDMEGLSFHNDGTLYGSTGANSTFAHRDSLFSIDTATGAATKIAPLLNLFADYEALACLSAGANTITGTVFEDDDADGLFDDPPEEGQPEVTVLLYIDNNNDGQVDAGDTLIQTTVTDSNGDYTFQVAAEGSFVIAIDPATLPAGSTLSTDNVEEADFIGFGNLDSGNDFGFTFPAALGNKVWLDENSDGYQDAGESGLVGITVELLDAGGSLITTTVTDGEGGYLFEDLAPGTYQVQVDAASLPAGLSQTVLNLAGQDFGNQAQPYSITLSSGDENLTGDFGYNWNPTTDVDGNTNTATLGDLVWIDSDGDGAQDPGELGAGGVIVNLLSAGPDGLFGTGDDVVAATTTTDANGAYIFDGLAPDAYIVVIDAANFAPGGALEGYTQTGDPDHFGTTGANDDQTTAPVILAAGDVALNADFGYQPPAAQDNSIGDTVFFDADADGLQGAGEPGIPSVTVTLIADDGDGLFDPANPGADEILATATTDENGNYLFDGLPDGSYVVWVNDTDNVLAELVQSADPDASIDEQTAVDLDSAGANPASVDDLDNDFGYTAPGQDTGDGLIGDVVFLDADGDGLPDPGEGLEGVTVELIQGGNLIATTVTDENGNYSFGDLDPNGIYTVSVDQTTLPPGLVNTADPDDDGIDGNGDEDAQSIVDLALTGPVDLDQDFGFAPAGTVGSIGDQIWLDSDADGVFDGAAGGDGLLGTDDDEPGIAGVTVDLYFDTDGDGQVDPGEGLVASTTTDASGVYTFSNLPADGGVDYVVGVTDEDGVLSGYQHSIGPNAGDGLTDDNSQVSPYGATLTTAEPDHLLADFGYYLEAAAIGNFVWQDLDADGVQDLGEPGIAGAVVTLTITYPGGSVITTSTLTDASGFYSFENLLLDEDFDGVGTPGVDEPTFVLTVATPAGFVPTLIDVSANAQDLEDSDDHAGTQALPVLGLTDIAQQADPNTEGQNASYDFGFQPTATLGDFIWDDLDGDGIQDPGEPGIPSVTVTLLDTGGNVVATTTTDPAGNYTFTDIVPGDYSILVTPPAGYLFSPQDQGGDDATDSDTDPVTGQTATITLVPGENNDTTDAGLFQPASLGDTVWEDLDGDGIQDAGEPGVPAVTVELLDAGGSVIATTATDAAGSYAFTGLAPGDYSVRFTAPAGFAITAQDQGGDDALDSDADTVTGQTALVTLAPGENKIDVDAGLFLGAALGNKVWLDENSDGYQDAGESGLVGITVELLDAGGSLITTTVTDGEGGYLFEDLAPGTYQVQVDAASLPAGLSQTVLNLAGQDFGNQAQPYSITLSSGDENLTGDFGYNWNPTTDVDGNTNTATLGDLVWIDSDGDGAQDPGELGADGVIVNLLSAGPDGLFGTGDDVVAATTTTDATGAYIFDGLAPDAYIVVIDAANFAPGGALEGYTQTGDPDHFGTTGANDDQTTAPVILAPGDVVLNADFGYQPPAAQDNSIGDTVFFDADADGLQGAGEPGIPSVTVTLIADDGDGLFDPDNPGADEILATVTTDENGNYLFNGLPDGSYVVWVNDTDNVLAELVQSADPDASIDEQTAVDLDSAGANPASVDDLDNDFGYTAPGQDTGDGLIGDVVFLDADGDGLPDPGEGLEGVTVELIQGGNLIATTVTDENGNYSFGDLDPNGIYTVSVDQTTLPPGLVNTADPDDDGIDGNGDEDAQSTVDLALTGPVDLDQDFGFAPAGTVGSIGDQIWLDSDADGVFDGAAGGDTLLGTDDDEPGIAGVTVDLYFDTDGDGQVDPGEGLVASTTTDASGVYTFSNLPADGGVDYVVVVTDEDGVLSGYQHSIGPDAGDGLTDDNSQVSPYGATLTTAEPDHLLADFGYYLEAAAIGNFVWQDLDADGVQDLGEPGIAGAVVTLTITYPGGSIITTSTLTDASGFYSFENLLLDEDFDGVGTPGVDEPTFVLTVATPAGFVPTLIDVSANAQDLEDSDDHAGTQASPVLGLTDVAQQADPNTEGQNASYDFGFQPTATLGDFIWDDLDGDGIQDPGEPGIPSVTVTLLDAGGNAVATTTTDPAGNYTFTDIVPGDYSILVTPPAGYLFSPLDQGGDDATDSDTDPVTGQTATITLVPGENNDTTDAGLFQPASLGDTVWEDLDGDGIQDAGEPGVPAVTVELLDAGGSVIATTATDAAGSYAFTGLAPGDYSVRFTAPAGFAITAQDQGGDDALDSDADTVTGQTALVTLISGENNTTLDAGLYLPTALGDYVWEDVNGDGLQDGFEPGIGGVLVDLLLADLTPVASTTTAADGSYSFTGLAPGDYVVAFTPPAGFSFSPQDQGGDDTLDSDADTVTGLTATISLASGETDNTVDAGMIAPPTEVSISHSGACLGDSGKTVLFWQVDSQIGTAGFLLDLYDPTSRRFEPVDGRLLAALPEAHAGATYYYPLTNARRGEAFTFRLLEIESRGHLRHQGTFTHRVEEACANVTIAGFTRVPTPISSAEGQRLADHRQDLEQARRARGERRGKAIKIAIEDSGLYQITTADIALLLDLPASTVEGHLVNRRLRLTSDGQDVAWQRKSDGTGLFFFGQAIVSPNTRYNIYRLEVGSALTMKIERNQTANPIATEQAFVHQEHFEDDRFAAPDLSRSADEDFWYWTRVNAGHPTEGSARFILDVDHAAQATGDASLTVTLRGATESGHRARISLNGQALGEASFRGTVEHRATFDFPQQALLPGENTVTVTARLEAGEFFSLFHVDSFDLRYAKHYQLSQNQPFFFRGDQNRTVTLHGTGDKEVMVFDISDASRPKSLRKINLQGDSRGFTVSFVPASEDTLYMATTPSATYQPVEIWAETSTDLLATSLDADYVLITDEMLLTAARALADLRQRQGLATRIVTTEEIYDNFSHGIVDPDAIRRFLAHAASEWRIPVRYATLLGDGTYDPLDHLGLGGHLVPVAMVPTPYGLFASDTAFGDLDRDGVLDLPVGRLPFLHPEEVAAYVTRLEERAALGSQTLHLTALVDLPDAAGNFVADSDRLLRLLRRNAAVTKTRLSEMDLLTARQQVRDAFANGTQWLDYIGHSSLGRYSDHGLLTREDIPALTVANPAPVITAWACASNRFALPGFRSLGEELVLQPQVSATVLSAVGLSQHDQAMVLATRFYRDARQRDVRVGDALVSAIHELAAQNHRPDMLLIYQILGESVAAIHE